jgi:capsular polysaccharide transport system permease protein
MPSPKPMPLLRRLRLTTLRQGAGRPAEDSDGQLPGQTPADAVKVVPLDRRQRRLRAIRPFSTPQLLVLPVLLSGIYFYGIARDRYVTRSDFVIRKSEEASMMGGESGGLVALLGRGNQLSLEDARYLRTYLQSPQVLADLSQSFDLEKVYARRGPDPWAGLREGASPEKRLDFFRRQVAVSLDEISGSIVLRTTALDPQSSFRLNRFMLAKSEQFVNRLNQDISLKQLAFAESELQRSRQRLAGARNRLLAYQNANAVLNAKGEAELASQTIGKLQEKLVELRVELAALRRQFKDPAEPEVASVADQVKELELQIANERRSAVSSKGRDLNRKAVEMARLESDVTFATDTYKLALSAVEKARVESTRQQKFMAMLSSPQLPEDPSNGWRSKGFFTVLAGLVVGVSLTRFVLGMQASHRT